MRKAQKGQGKTSLKEMLARHPEPKRNDWSNGRPNVPAESRIGADGFPEYDPKAFESGSEDGGEGPSAGGAFAILAGFSGDAASEDGDWMQVKSAKTKKNQASSSAAGPSTSSAAAASAAVRRPPASSPAAGPRSPAAAAASGVAATGFSARLNAAAAAGASGSGSTPASGSRTPYILAQGGVPPPRAVRPQTHNADGKPISDTYYQSFQRVYRNANGAACMRFHKTDVVIVHANGDVQVTSGGYRTRTTFQSVTEALEPLGLSLHSSMGGEGRGEWSVGLPDGTRVPWQDGLLLPARNAEERSRGDKLIAAFYGAGAAGAGAGGRGAAADSGAARPQQAAPSAAAAASVPRVTQTPAGTATSSTSSAAASPARPAPSAWSYRSASAPYAPHLRPPVPVPVPMPQPNSVTNPYAAAPAAAAATGPRATANPDELAALLDKALALQTSAAGGEGALDDEHACIVCMERQKTTILIPCGHLILCGECAEDVVGRTRTCPMCRTVVADQVTVS